ncbi:MAG TPA: DUF2271 domain-containing protein [Bacteroidales bacterium]|nr:DUF2271 domain-containing protein [Bacteroidales bacterium]HRZ48526.1 DUF2271 domain-containing protein [Bacteroidales bacterium]
MKQLTIVVLSLLLGSILARGQNTPGTVTFTVTTTANGGKYAPNHVLAIWIKNSSGTFIRTSKMMSQKETKYLYQWKASSSLNTVDAITGATLTSHQTHTITWNCKDLNNNVVPDGTYQFWIEFADADAQGPYAHFDFNKSTSAVNTNYPNQSKFSGVNITYTPQPNGIGKNEAEARATVITHGKTITFSIPDDKTGRAELAVYNLQGQLVYHEKSPVSAGNYLVFSWDAEKTKGVYIYSITTQKTTYTGKLAHAW